MKKLLFILFICPLVISSYGQVTISGVVNDLENHPLTYINVLLKKNDSTNRIYAFAITDQYGRYSIQYNTADQKTVVLEAYSLIYKKKRELLSISPNNKTHTINFMLEEAIVELEEVSVEAEAPYVQQKNDTTIFNLEKITDGTEVVVEDILKKLPGVEIDNQGKIRFKGKEVKNVLLEGDNLFDGSYTIGTKNINANHINGVEAIENFDDNPLLQGLTNNENVALNLNFKKDLSLSADVELGYGYRNQYSGKITSIAISKKLKGFSLNSYSNMGSRGLNTTQHLVGLIDGNSFQQLTTPGYLTSQGSFSGGNTIENSAFSSSINLLPRLSPTETIRANVNYFSDRSLEENSSSTTIIIDPSNPIVIGQSERTITKPRFFNAKLQYQKFLGKKSFISTKMEATKAHNTKELSGVRNSLAQHENIKAREQYIANFTKYVYKINDRSALTFETALAHSEKPEELTIQSGIDFSTNTVVPNTTNSQNIFSKKQTAVLKTSYYRKTVKKDKLSVEAEIDYMKHSLQSNLLDISEISAHNNDFEYTYSIPKVEVKYFWQRGNVEIEPLLKVGVFTYQYSDKFAASKQTGNRLLNDAQLSLKYNLNQFQSINFNINTNNDSPDEKRLYNGFILKSNKVIENNVTTFDKLTSFYFNAGYKYTALLDDFRAALNYSYGKNNNDYFQSQLVTQDVAYSTYFLTNRGSDNSSWNASFDKNISLIKSEVKVNITYAKSKYFNIVNDSDFRLNSSNNLNVDFTLNTFFIGSFLFANSIKYSMTEFNTPNSESIVNKQLSDVFTARYVTGKRISGDVKFNYGIPSIDRKDEKIYFLDATLKYVIRDRRLTFKLEGKNLLNQQAITKNNNTDFSSSQSTQTLLDPYFLFTFGFKI